MIVRATFFNTPNLFSSGNLAAALAEVLKNAVIDDSNLNMENNDIYKEGEEVQTERTAF